LKRIRELDGLRGIAVALVVIRHYIHHPSFVLFGPQWGWAGVNLFFVLSGFLITSILLRTAETQASLKTFYVRRTLRIFPIYYLVLIIYFTASASVRFAQPWNTVAVYLLFLQAILPPSITHLHMFPHPGWIIAGISVLWSLSVEEFFYLLWAPLIVFTRARRKLLLQFLTIVLLFTPLLRFFYPDPHGIQEMFLGQMDSLAAGALLAILWKDHAEILRPWAQKNAGRLYLACIGFLGGAIWIDLATGIPYKTPLQTRIFDATDYTLLWAGWGLLLLITLACSGLQRPFPRLLRNAGLRWLGTISYCLYLVHYPIYMIWRNYLPHIAAVPVALATSLAVSAISWQFLEGPIMRWKQNSFQYREALTNSPTGHSAGK
jgi:peptidoglycan/LPS O-acetylase OafA/YrhL